MTRGLLENLVWLLVRIRYGSPATKHNFVMYLTEDYSNYI